MAGAFQVIFSRAGPPERTRLGEQHMQGKEPGARKAERGAAVCDHNGETTPPRQTRPWWVKPRPRSIGTGGGAVCSPAGGRHLPWMQVPGGGPAAPKRKYTHETIIDPLTQGRV